MAVTFATGFEGRAAAVDGITLMGSIAYSTAQYRTGAASIRCNVASGASGYFPNPSPAAYQHFGLYVASVPSVNRLIFGLIGANSINVRLLSDGTLGVYVYTTLIGTSSVLSTATWYWIGVRMTTGTSVVYLQIDGVDTVTGTATGGSYGPIGPSGTEASVIDIYIDDYIVDDTGFLAPSKVDIALPISDNARTAVTGGAGGTTNLWDAVNNTPPAGVASASETNITNIKFPASATESYTANLETYTTLGIVSADTVLAVQSVIRHGEDITTGTKNGTLGAVSNPTISDALAFVFGSDGGAHAAESGTNFWVTEFGTLTASPSVTLGTSPTLTVSRASQTRVGCIDFMGLLVAWTPYVSSGTNAPAGLASCTGAAYSGSISLAPAAGIATGTGASYGATVVISKYVDAGLASATGAAYVVPILYAPVGLASGTGASNAPPARIAPNSGIASGSGAAYAAANQITPNSGVATGTGTAQSPSTNVAALAGIATGTGVALSATVTTASGTNAPAGLASGSGSAVAPSGSIAPVAGSAAGTGAAYNAPIEYAPAGLASATGTAYDVSGSIAPVAGSAAGTGAAYNVPFGVNAPAGLASGTGTAYGTSMQYAPAGLASATASAGAPTTAASVNAGVSTATGAANAPTAAPRASAGLASGAGAALDAGKATAVDAGLASATGAAYNAPIEYAPAGLASGSGSAVAPSGSIAPVAGSAAGTGAAYNVPFGVNAPAGLASGTGTALGATTTSASPVFANAGRATATGAALGVTAPTLMGRTLDENGDAIASCTVDAFRSSDNVFVGTTTSDTLGVYRIVVAPGVNHFLVAYSATSVYGVTQRDLSA